MTPAQKRHSWDSAASATMLRIDMRQRPDNNGDELLAAAEQADADWLRDELALSWRSAQDDAVAAYQVWCRYPGPGGYARYRAAQDRADQAQDALAAA